MANKSSHSLYDLIKSLSKSEKRYFKIHAGRHVIGHENNYVRLFDYLDQQSDYDEERLSAYFSGEAFLKQFSITKKRLYDQILQALDAFHKPTSVNAQLFTMLHAAEILFNKALYAQCRKMLLSIEKQAEKTQKWEFVLLVADLRRRLIETEGVNDKDMPDLSMETTVYIDNIEALKSIQQLWELKTRLFHKIQQCGMIRSEEERSVFSHLLKELDAIEIPSTKNLRATYLFHHLMSAYCYATKNFKESLAHLQKNIELCCENAEVFNNDVQKNITAITNAIYIADNLGDHQLVRKYLTLLKRLAEEPNLTDDDHVKLFASTGSIELSLLVRSGDFIHALELLPGYLNKFNAIQEKLNPSRRSFICYKIAVIYLANGAFGEALKWLNRILSDSRQDQREDIAGFTQLLVLLIHIELENEEVLPYALKSVRRFFQTRHKLNEFERIFLKFTARWIRQKAKMQRLDLWQELHDDLSHLLLISDYAVNIREYFDFQAWTEAKLKQRSFPTVMRERYYQHLGKAV